MARYQSAVAAFMDAVGRARFRRVAGETLEPSQVGFPQRRRVAPPIEHDVRIRVADQGDEHLDQEDDPLELGSIPRRNLAQGEVHRVGDMGVDGGEPRLEPVDRWQWHGGEPGRARREARISDLLGLEPRRRPEPSPCHDEEHRQPP